MSENKGENVDKTNEQLAEEKVENADEHLTEDELGQSDPSEDDKMYLTEEENLRLQLAMQKQDIASYKIACVSKDQKICELEADVLEMRARVKQEEATRLKLTADGLKRDKLNALNEYKALTGKITEKYGLTSKWGFDPDSGEIKDGLTADQK